MGLSAPQATLYVHLLRAGPSRASEVASQVGMRRPETYRILQQMAEEGWVTLLFARPTLFAASPPETLFERAERKEEARKARVLDAKGAILQALADLTPVVPGPDRSSYRVTQGRAEGYHLLEQLVARADQGVDVLVTDPSLAAALARRRTFWEKVKQRAASGLTFRCVLPPDTALRRHLGPVGGAAAFREYGPHSFLRLAIADRRQAATWVAAVEKAPQQDSALWTDAPDLVATLGLLFDLVWQQAERGAVAPRPAPAAAKAPTAAWPRILPLE